MSSLFLFSVPEKSFPNSGRLRKTLWSQKRWFGIRRLDWKAIWLVLHPNPKSHVWSFSALCPLTMLPSFYPLKQPLLVDFTDILICCFHCAVCLSSASFHFRVFFHKEQFYQPWNSWHKLLKLCFSYVILFFLKALAGSDLLGSQCKRPDSNRSFFSSEEMKHSRLTVNHGDW